MNTEERKARSCPKYNKLLDEYYKLITPTDPLTKHEKEDEFKKMMLLCTT
jgi:hypothetical protein